MVATATPAPNDSKDALLDSTQAAISLAIDAAPETIALIAGSSEVPIETARFSKVPVNIRHWFADEPAVRSRSPVASVIPFVMRLARARTLSC